MKTSTSDDQHQKEAPSPSPKQHAVVKHLTQNIQPNISSELQLLLLTFSTGIQGESLSGLNLICGGVRSD